MPISVKVGSVFKDVPTPAWVKVNGSFKKCEQEWIKIGNEFKPVFDPLPIYNNFKIFSYDFSVDRWLNIGVQLSVNGGNFVVTSDGDARTSFTNLQKSPEFVKGLQLPKYCDSILVTVVKTSNDGSDYMEVRNSWIPGITQHCGRYSYYYVDLYHNDDAGGAQNAGHVDVYITAYPKGKNMFDSQGKMSYPAYCYVTGDMQYNHQGDTVGQHHTDDLALGNKVPQTLNPYGYAAIDAKLRVNSALPTATPGIVTTITTESGVYLRFGRFYTNQWAFFIKAALTNGVPNGNSATVQIAQIVPGTDYIAVYNGGNGFEWQKVTSIVNETDTGQYGPMTIVHSESDIVSLGRDPNNPFSTGDRLIAMKCLHNKFDVYNSGSDLGGGGGGGCVAINMYMDVQRLALDINIGDVIDGSAYDPDCVVPRTVRANRVMTQECFRMVTESGIALVASDSTPMTMRDGSMKMLPDMLGEEVLVDDRGDIRWEKVTSLVAVGPHDVVLFNVDDQSYFAGEVGNRRIATHNAANQKN